MTNKKTLIGKVVSTKREKTITVVVDTYKKHPLYGKRFKSSKKFAAHDEKGEAKLGDTVKIIETRPLSATKKFRLLEVLASDQEAATDVAAANAAKAEAKAKAEEAKAAKEAKVKAEEAKTTQEAPAAEEVKVGGDE